MKKIIILALGLISLLNTENLYAQVNLDEPLAVGIGDRYFKSSSDENVVYTIPIGLYRVTPFYMKKVGKRLHAEFKMGLFKEQFTTGESLVKQIIPTASLKMFRATDASYFADASDIPNEFDPVLHGAQSFENLMGPTHVYLDINKSARVAWYNIFPLSGKALLKEVFGRREDGEIFGDHIGSIEYQFISTQAGQKRLSKTRVGVYVSESHLPKEVSPKINSFELFSADRRLDEIIPEPSRSEIPLKITDSKLNACWNEELEIGEICLGEIAP